MLLICVGRKMTLVGVLCAVVFALSVAGASPAAADEVISSRPQILLAGYSSRRSENKSIRRFNRMVRRGRVSGGYSTQPEMSGLQPASNTAGTPPATVVEEIKISADEQAASRLNNQLAFDLYQKLQEQSGNTIFSPLSVSTALAMLVGAADGDTKQQLANVLHLDQPESQLHAGFGSLTARLNAKGQDNTLNLANRLWVQQGFRFESRYLALLRESYGADLGEVNFGDPNAARVNINSWVEQVTSGRIPEVIPTNLLDDQVRSVLTNVIYFKGTWKYRFPPAATQQLDFHVATDRSVKVAMMHQVGADFRYAATPDAQLLELPYVGNQLSMVVLLPKERHGLSKLESQLSAAELQTWLATLKEQEEVDIQLPKFRFTTQTSVKDVLISLGMPLAFSNDADFSRLTREKAQKLFEVLHEAYVEVYEEGTEAAAVTGAIGGDAPGPVPQTIDFHADHPFLFLIRDVRTGAILFLGRVVNPNV